MKITKKTLLTHSLLMLSCLGIHGSMALASSEWPMKAGAGAPASRTGGGSHSPEDVSVDIDQLMRDIMIAEKSVCRRVQEIDSLGQKTKVIVLGVTGAGKSTVLHALAGKRLMVKRGAGKMEIYAAPHCQEH